MYLCVGKKRGMLVTSTLRVSEKRSPSCKDMPSVTEAESWSSWVWVWEETDDGDIATASMGKQDGSLPCCQDRFVLPAPGAAKPLPATLLGNQNPPRKQGAFEGGWGRRRRSSNPLGWRRWLTYEPMNMTRKEGEGGS
jgi:hypothetical protein